MTKKFVFFIVCLLFVVTGLWGAGGFNLAVQALDGDADDTGVTEQTAFPPGISARYRDSEDTGARTTEINPENTDNYIRHHDRFGALYNTSGYLVISGIDDAGQKINGLDFEVLFHDDLEDVEGTQVEVTDEIDEYGRYIYNWKYDAIGIYSIIITMGYKENVHEFSESCVAPVCGNEDEEHVHDGECYDFVCSYTCGHCREENCEYCNPSYDLLSFEFLSVCKNSVPDFGALFTSGNSTFTEDYNLASDTRFEIKARVKGTNFYWDETSVVYVSGCDLLTVSDDGKYLILKKADAGVHIISFEIVFNFRDVAEDGVINQAIQKRMPVSFEITFFNAPKQPSILDVLIGLLVLGLLVGAAYFITRLSKSIEKH